MTKPIVAQIYRTWQDTDGEKWINTCWYYRPEQTVHQYEKHFFPNEVVKTGQYRDHRIDEIMDRCFVMFTTRYSRGRPRGLSADKEVYVCDSRYNEEKHKLNKIKTWASCLPDEVRDKDYEMDLFDGIKKVKKVPSPILHLLKEDAKEADELPKPRWGADNAPPVVGAVYKGPRDENVSLRNSLLPIPINTDRKCSNPLLQSQHHRHLHKQLLCQPKHPTMHPTMTRLIIAEIARAMPSWEARLISRPPLEPLHLTITMPRATTLLYRSIIRTPLPPHPSSILINSPNSLQILTHSLNTPPSVYLKSIIIPLLLIAMHRPQVREFLVSTSILSVKQRYGIFPRMPI